MEKCEICGRQLKNKRSLSSHIRLTHCSIQEYYDKYLLKENEDICATCGKNNIFGGLVYGYKKGCCREHMNINGYNCRKEHSLKNYGVENPFQRKDVKEKIKTTWIKNYGVDNPNKHYKIRNKIKETNIKKYGVDHNFKTDESKEKRKDTWIKNYGVDNPFKSNLVKEKIKKTNLEKYGVDNPQQNLEIHHKTLKTQRFLKKFKETDLTYQGSYELDFLEKFYDIIDINNGLDISYLVSDRNKIYHSDFYIPSKNLIVEIKSTYILKLDEEIEYKKKACIEQGYNYILILNKNYKEFEKTIL